MRCAAVFTLGSEQGLQAVCAHMSVIQITLPTIVTMQGLRYDTVPVQALETYNRQSTGRTQGWWNARQICDFPMERDSGHIFALA